MKSSSSVGGACRGRRAGAWRLPRSLPSSLHRSGPRARIPIARKTKQTLACQVMVPVSDRAPSTLKPCRDRADSESDSRRGLTAISQAWSFEKGRRTTPPFSLRESAIRGSGSRSARRSLKAAASRRLALLGMLLAQGGEGRRSATRAIAHAGCVTQSGPFGPPSRPRRPRVAPSRARRWCPRRARRPGRRRPRAARPCEAPSCVTGH